MRFGIKTAPQHTTWNEMLAVWRAVDAIELFESAWNFDHFYPLVGDTEGPCLESWVTLSALAQMTSRIRIGCMVNGTPYRHPALLANMAASLDIVSGGRLDLGLGAGWNQHEAAAPFFRFFVHAKGVRFCEGDTERRSRITEHSFIVG